MSIPISKERHADHPGSPAERRCDCGATVTLYSFTNPCDRCGARYNMSGRRLAVLARWYHRHVDRIWTIIIVLAIFGFMGIVHAIIDAKRPGGCASYPLTIMDCL